MDAEISKAELRTRIRSERARRAHETNPAGAESAADSVAESAWRLIESLIPGPDLAGSAMLAYAALPGEPDLDPVIDAFLACGGSVYLPVVTAVGQALMFGRVEGSMESLRPQGKWGIREPVPQLGPAELMSAEVALDLVFVPALGFGAGGARLGNGGGFYDRTFGPLGQAPLDSTRFAAAAPTVYGVCFAAELDLPGLTVEPWDLRIDQAVSESGVHRFS